MGPQIAAWITSAVLVSVVPLGADQKPQPVPASSTTSGRNEHFRAAQSFWRPRITTSNSLFDAVWEFNRSADDDRVQRSRGVARPLNFRYRNFSYERNYFHVYKGFTLRSFMDGRFDLGLYKHNVNRGLLFGPQGAYLPSTSKRLELMIRWNLGNH